MLKRKLLVACLAVVVGCATVRPVFDAFKECTSPLICDLGEKIRPEAEKVLVCGVATNAVPACVLSGLHELAKSVGKNGPAAVNCLVEKLSKLRGAAPGSEGDLQQRNAALYVDYLKTRGEQAAE